MIDVVIVRDSHGSIQVNIKQDVVHHSPDGFEIGYSGSGPADLALNILNRYFYDDKEQQECWKGKCSKMAWLLHQDFKSDFIVNMKKEGAVLKGDDIENWIGNKISKYKEMI